MRILAQTIRGSANALFALIGLMGVTGGGIFRVGRAKIEVASPEVWMIALILLACLWTRGLKRPLGDLGWTGRAVRWMEKRLGSAGSTRKPALFLAAAVFALLWLAHVLRHYALHNHGCDVSMVHQALFYPWGDPPLRADFSRVGTALSEHLVYAFFLLAPLTAATKSGVLIYTVQAALIGGATAWLVVKGPLKRAPAAMLFGAMILLCSKPLRASVVWDFREDGIAYFALIGMTVSLLSRRLWLYWACFALAILTKENLFAITLCFAVPILFSREIALSARGRIQLAALTGALSVAYAVLAFKVLIPMYTHNDQGHALFARYGAYGSSVPEIVVNVLTQPRAWVQLGGEVFNASGIKYLLFLLLPLVPFMRSRETWIWAFPAFAGIAMNVAHPYHTQRMMIFHYELISLPFLFMGVLLGVRAAVQARRYRAVVWSLALAVCVFGRSPVFEVTQHWPSARDFETSRFLNGFRQDSRVAVEERLSAQLNHLPRLRVFSIPVEPPLDFGAWYAKAIGSEARWVVIDQDIPFQQTLRDWLLKKEAKIGWGRLGETRALLLELPAGGVLPPAQP